jgi:T-complex protein 1 subunit beta
MSALSNDMGKAINILNEQASEEKGDMARLTTYIGGMALSDLIKTTLGPKGMDKILVNPEHDEITITNDGATIMKAVPLANPAAKILVDIAKTQDAEVGDGTTSVVVLAGELLREGEKLYMQRIHPQIVIEGWRKAQEAARAALESAGIDHSDDADAFRRDLLNIARTTISSKILSTNKEHFAELAVEAVLRLQGSGNLSAIHVIKKVGATLRDSYLDDGFILEKTFGVGQPKRIENARILIANTAMDYDKVKIFGATVRVDNVAQVAAIEEAERQRMFAKCDKIIAHGCNVFVNRQLIYNLAEQYFTDHDVVSIEHADFDGIERLALVTGGEIVSTFDHPELVQLGTCELIEEISIGQDRAIHFSGTPLHESCTIVLRGATDAVLEEANRSLHDALCVLAATVKHRRTVLGGGCTEMIMAQAVDDAADQTPGKAALAMRSFAHALRQIPTILADNGGFDSVELVAQLRAAHKQGDRTAGLDLDAGQVADVAQLGITESFRVKEQILMSASEAAELIVRADAVIRAAPRQRSQEHY